MTKFNVGDKVQFVEKFGKHKVGDVVEITGLKNSNHIYFKGEHGKGDCYTRRVKLTEPKLTKNQRITALENEVAELRPLKQEVAELKLIVHELRGKKSIEPSTINTVEDIIEFEGKQYRKVDREAREGDVVIFTKIPREDRTTKDVQDNKPYKVRLDLNGRTVIKDDDDSMLYVYGGGVLKGTHETVDVYELIEGGLNPNIPMVDETIEPLTPNQQRAVVIEKAKKFVEEMLDGRELMVPDSRGSFLPPWYITDFDYVVNTEKRTIVVLCKGTKGIVRERGIAKCNPNDVFNEHIGKAIALGRALGLNVSEFEQAVQPNEVVPGHIIVWNEATNEPYKVVSKNGDWFDFINLKDNKNYNNHEYCEIEENVKILNDTNAIYGGVE